MTTEARSTDSLIRIRHSQCFGDAARKRHTPGHPIGTTGGMRTHADALAPAGGERPAAARSAAALEEPGIVRVVTPVAPAWLPRPTQSPFIARNGALTWARLEGFEPQSSDPLPTVTYEQCAAVPDSGDRVPLVAVVVTAVVRIPKARAPAERAVRRSLRRAGCLKHRRSRVVGDRVLKPNERLPPNAT